MMPIVFELIPLANMVAMATTLKFVFALVHEKHATDFNEIWSKHWLQVKDDACRF